jgi:PTH1 family peptidyl-tRNA hydrolase
VEQVYLIAGLGNPGREYADTRHNCGFLVVERLAERMKAHWKNESKFQARLAKGMSAGRTVILCQPTTYMNRSGVAVQAAAAYYKVPLAQLVAVVDDADLPLGTIRMRPGGSSGGHHGLESIEAHLGLRDFARVRVGIGRKAEGQREITDYVLGRFERGEKPLLEAILDRACNQIECWLGSGIEQAMNRFNGTIEPPLVKES